MRFHRPLRVGKLIREELGKIISREMEFPGILLTITEVEIDRKLETAKVKVSILPSEKADEILLVLNKKRGRLQYFLTRKINIMPMPRIHFEIDRGPEKAARIEKLLMEEDNK